MGYELERAGVPHVIGDASMFRVPASMAEPLASLAKQRGVSFAEVVKAAMDDDLLRIVNLRSRKTLSPSLPGWGARTGDDVAMVLAHKKHTDW
jgi:hypothetical protein